MRGQADWLTDVVLVITGVFGVWAVSLVVLTVIGITQPAFYYSDQKSTIKAAGSTVVVLLTFSQFYTIESVLGHLPRGSIKMRSMMRVHRWGGRIAIVLAATIAFFCMTDNRQPLAGVGPCGGLRPWSSPRAASRRR